MSQLGRKGERRRKSRRGRRVGRKNQPGYLSIILALQRLGQEDYELKGSLTDIRKERKMKKGEMLMEGKKGNRG